MPSLTLPLDPLINPELTSQLDVSRRLARLFRARGYELFLVGGAVRDALLGSSSDELDFGTSAPASETADLLAEFSGRMPYRVGERFGTIGSIVGSHTVEVTTYRSRELYDEGSRKPKVEFGHTIEEDLARRDFTLNAIAVDPLDGTLVDPYHGVDDLRTGLLRAVGSPEDRFREDPLRLLRAVRFAARFDFEIELGTARAMRQQAPALASISRERIRDEYSRYLESARPVAALTLLRDFALFESSVPQLMQLTLMPDHGANHPLSLWDHTMRVVAAVPARRVPRWAALLHDIAKPATRTLEPDGRTRFFHHETRGALVAERILGGLRYPASEIEDVRLLVETHMQLHAYSPEWSDGAVRRLCLRLGPLMPDALQLARADAAGHTDDGSSSNSPKFDALQHRLESLGTDSVHSLTSPLSGDDLMQRYARPPGRWIQHIKDRLLDEVLEGRLRPDDRAGAWTIADRLVQSTDW